MIPTSQRWTVLSGMALLALFLTGEIRAAAPKPPTGIAARRWAWFYTKGSFKKVTSTQWVEQGSSAKNSFREMARKPNYVELHDAKSKVSVRLYNSSMYTWSPTTRKWNFHRNGRWDDPRKKPISEDRFPDERGHLTTPVERKSFPHLGRDYEVLSPATPRYNCIAWSIGITHQWVWPVKPNKPISVGDFDELYGRHGYRRISGLNFDKATGYDKIVLYVKRKPNGAIEPTHGARQLADGSWSSKLGKLPLIRHLDPDDLDGASYGVPHAVYVRPQKKK